MAVMQMQKVSICALKKDRKAILEKLQSMGVMEIKRMNPEEIGFQTENTMNEKQSFERSAQVAEQALEVLEIYVPEKHSIFSSLEGKKLIADDRYEEITGRKEAVMETAKRLIALNKETAEHKAAILKYENQIESMRPWMSLGVPMNYEGTAKTSMLAGTMAGGTTLEDVYALLAERAPEAEAVDVQVIASEKEALYLVVFCLKSQESLVEDALRSGGFARPSQMSELTPAKEKVALEDEIRKLNDRIDEIKKEIEESADSREDLKVISDYYRLRAGKYEVLGTLAQSRSTFIVSGYVAGKYVPAIEKAVGERFNCVIDVEDLAEDEEAPVLLSNNPIAEKMEGITESYGLPHKGEFDPTAIMSFFYIFFFGMMLSDAGYGAIIAIACFVMLKKYPRMSKSMNKSLSMFMYCGISTVVWGVLFGGYFGNVVDVISQNFFGKTVTVPALWFVPLNEPTKLLIYSLAFGIVHLLVGLGLKGYMLVKEGRMLDFFCDVIIWYVLLIGLILMLIPSSVFTSIAQTQIVFPPALHTLSKAMVIAGLLGLLLMSGRSSKNPVLRLALGAYDIYNLTGWLSDVLSYSRLLALGLATGVIAQVVNQMGSLFGKGIVGAIGFALVFVIGHALSLAINLLGAYVHTNRLQYVEFFGKFYEGGGRAFVPFESDTKYVDIKEEI